MTKKGACNDAKWRNTAVIKLSIIIPCYNCEGTLAEAVDSIFRQESAIPFDITMVDDGSTDGTNGVMAALAQLHPEIKLVRHSSNRGGGPARNTAVASSDGDLIFCLDSDDILGPDFLKNMTRYWLDKRCDGVGISKSIKFRNSNLRDVAYVTDFEGPGRQVRLESLFDSSACSLFSTFLITRAAFDCVGGYPTAHGFDTQGMAFRFLYSGLTAYTCPEAVYYHRVEHGQSYYVREAGAGRTHWNWFKIFQEFLYLFQDEVKARILDYECFPSSPQPTIESVLRTLPQDIYVDGYRDLIHAGRDKAAAQLGASPNKYEQYWVGTYFLSKARYAEALDHLVRALHGGFIHRIGYCELLEAALKASGSSTPARITIGGLTYHVNDPVRVAESSAAPLSRYQEFENDLMRRGGLRFLGIALKRARQLVRRLRRTRSS